MITKMICFKPFETFHEAIEKVIDDSIQNLTKIFTGLTNYI